MYYNTCRLDNGFGSRQLLRLLLSGCPQKSIQLILPYCNLTICSSLKFLKKLTTLSQRFVLYEIKHNTFCIICQQFFIFRKSILFSRKFYNTTLPLYDYEKYTNSSAGASTGFTSTAYSTGPFPRYSLANSTWISAVISTQDLWGISAALS